MRDEMAEIKQSNGRPVIDYMARDYESLLQSMRTLIPEKLPEWQDFQSEADFGNVLLQLFAHMGDILSYYQDRVANESFLGTAQTRRSIIQHLSLIGYKLATAAPASALLQLTAPSTFNGTITINKGDAFATRSQKNKPSVRFEYTGDNPLTFDFNSPDVKTFPQPGASSYVWVDPKTGAKTIVCLDSKTGEPLLDAPGTGKPLGCLPVEEGRLIKDEILGASDGERNQRFRLAHNGLILRPTGQTNQPNKDIVITITGESDQWTLQESLAFSQDQRDYVIEVDENDQATVVFGDGTFGKIPTKAATITATYRVGGGSLGNVAADAIQTIVNAPQLALIGAKITNPLRATGGADRESIEHAVLHAPAVFRSDKRAVTGRDYESLALNLRGVGKVRAERSNWNTVTLYVAPDGGGQVNDVLESNLLAFLEDKRPLSTIIEIADVDYVKIYVTAHVGVKSYYSRAEINAKIQAAAGDLLAFENVDFAQTVYLSKFYEVIEAIEGVQFVNITEFTRKTPHPCPVPPADALTSDPVAPSGKIVLCPNEIATPPDKDETGYESGIRLEMEGGF